MGWWIRRWVAVALLWNVACFAAGENAAYFLGDESEAGNARWDLIAGERREITAVVHIWEVNKLGLAGLAGLRAAAQRGAKVRLVIDGFGAQFWNPKSVFYPELVSALRQSGVDVRIYAPVSAPTDVLLPGGLDRLHHKLIYFGSQDILLTGDRNFQNDNFPGGRSAKDGQRTKSFASVETLVQGPAARQARAYAMKVWEIAKAPEGSSDAGKIAREIEKLDRVRDVMESARRDAQDWSKKLTAVDGVKFLGDEPRIAPHDDAVTAGLVELVDGARENIRMTLPFNILATSLENAIRRAARRGVTVDILLPAEPAVPLANTIALAFRTQANRLQTAGVRVHQFTGDRWLHAKLLQVDGKSTFVGSHNFNPRSVETDLESGVIIDDAHYGKTAADFFDRWIRDDSVRYVPRRMGFFEVCRVAFSSLLWGFPGVRRQF